MKKQKHTMAFRVNDTTSAVMPTVLKMARRRLEKRGYTVNNLVWNKIEDAE